MTASPSNSDETPTACPTTTCACGPWWRLPLLLGLVLAAILLANGRGLRRNARVSDGPAATAPAAVPAADSVGLIIDFGDRRLPQSESVKWSKGMTVRDLLNAVPRLSVAQQGSGASAFLTEIDGVKNEGAGGRNWIYSVNGQRGDRSFAVYELQPGDYVLWSFAPPQ